MMFEGVSQLESLPGVSSLPHFGELGNTLIQLRLPHERTRVTPVQFFDLL